jgi:NAD+ kinase
MTDAWKGLVWLGMRFTVIHRSDDRSKILAEQFRNKAEKQGLVWDAKQPEMVVSIGGDGTMLSAFHQYNDQLDSVAFFGIHTGHLGFFADWQVDEIDELMGHIGLMEPHIVAFPLVSVEVQTRKDLVHHLVLNETAVKGVQNETIVMQVNINDEMFEMFRGDGIVTSTPLGSTAYNKGLGGALIHPSISAMQMTEIASINNRVFRTLGSPIVVPQHHMVEIIPQKDQSLFISFDHLNITRRDIKSIRLQVAKETVRFARYKPFPFWHRVREAFLQE